MLIVHLRPHLHSKYYQYSKEEFVVFINIQKSIINFQHGLRMQKEYSLF